MGTKWYDWLFAFWVVFVGVVYYGGSVGVFAPVSSGPPLPWVSGRTDILAMVYAIMLIVSVMCAVFARLRKLESDRSIGVDSAIRK